MEQKLSRELKEALENKERFRVIVTSGKEGKVSVQKVHSLRVTDHGKLLYLEYIESSPSNKNLIYSLWFNKEVAFLVETVEGKTYEVRGIPKRSIIEGDYFEKEYRKVQEEYEGRIDLSTIWEIEITSIEDNSLEICSRNEQDTYPIIQHLDRIAKEE